MTAKVFVDTNILVYAVSRASADQDKAERAREILLREEVGFSTQVLQELFVTVTRKRSPPLTADEGLRLVRQFARRPCIAISVPMIEMAIDWQQRHQLSYWDAAILVAAHHLEAKTVYSEDLSHQQTYDDVRVINPFR